MFDIIKFYIKVKEESDNSLYKINIEKLEHIIKYTFNNKDIAYIAFCHSSYVNEKKSNKTASYERLEFLGDSIVNMIVSEHLYENYPNLPEGELTKVRAIVVCEPTFYKCSKKLGLGQFLLLGKGEEHTGGRERVSILADIFESVTGAIFLDAGFGEAKRFAISQLKDTIVDAVNGMVFMDYKTQLQEVLQKNSNSKISYIIIDESGPDHNKEFVIQVNNGDKVLGMGKGKSKKEAEQSAAKEALEKVK